MSQHLTFTKWKDSAFSTEQLRTTRWLLGARPKNIPDGYHELLTVTPMAQEMLMDLHVKSFLRATRRVKSAARSRARLCADDFDRLVDFACVFAHIRKCAMRVVSKSRDVDSKLMAAFLAKFLGFHVFRCYAHVVLYFFERDHHTPPRAKQQ